MAVGLDPQLGFRPKGFHRQGKGRDAVHTGDVDPDDLAFERGQGAAHVGGEKGDVVLEDFGEVVTAQGDAAIGEVLTLPIIHHLGSAGQTDAAALLLVFAQVVDVNDLTGLALFDDVINTRLRGHLFACDGDEDIVLLQTGGFGGAFAGDADNAHSFAIFDGLFVHADAHGGPLARNAAEFGADNADARFLACIRHTAQPLAEAE